MNRLKYRNAKHMKYPNFIERMILNTLNPERFCGYIEHYMIHNHYKDLTYHCHPIINNGKAVNAYCWGKLS